MSCVYTKCERWTGCRRERRETEICTNIFFVDDKYPIGISLGKWTQPIFMDVDFLKDTLAPFWCLTWSPRGVAVRYHSSIHIPSVWFYFGTPDCRSRHLLKNKGEAFSDNFGEVLGQPVTSIQSQGRKSMFIKTSNYLLACEVQIQWRKVWKVR